MHIQSKLSQRTFVMGASSDLGLPFRPRQNIGVWVGNENRLSRYDGRAGGALPRNINESESKNLAIEFAMFLLRELIPKYKYVCFEFLMKVIVALILKGCFRNIKGNGLQIKESFKCFKK